MFADTHDTSALPAAAGEALFQGLALKMLVIDAICGVGFPTHGLGMACEAAGVARLIDAHAFTYAWDRNALAKNTIARLQELYEALCLAREETSTGAAQ